MICSYVNLILVLQVVRGVPGVVPSEPNFHDQFKGGIFWLSCKNAQLIGTSVTACCDVQRLSRDCVQNCS